MFPDPYQAWKNVSQTETSQVEKGFMDHQQPVEFASSSTKDSADDNDSKQVDKANEVDSIQLDMAMGSDDWMSGLSPTIRGYIPDVHPLETSQDWQSKMDEVTSMEPISQPIDVLYSPENNDYPLQTQDTGEGIGMNGSRGLDAIISEVLEDDHRASLIRMTAADEREYGGSHRLQEGTETRHGVVNVAMAEDVLTEDIPQNIDRKEAEDVLTEDIPQNIDRKEAEETVADNIEFMTVVHRVNKEKASEKNEELYSTPNPLPKSADDVRSSEPQQGSKKQKVVVSQLPFSNLIPKPIGGMEEVPWGTSQVFSVLLPAQNHHASSASPKPAEDIISLNEHDRHEKEKLGTLKHANELSIPALIPKPLGGALEIPWGTSQVFSVLFPTQLCQGPILQQEQKGENGAHAPSLLTQKLTSQGPHNRRDGPLLCDDLEDDLLVNRLRARRISMPKKARCHNMKDIILQMCSEPLSPEATDPNVSLLDVVGKSGIIRKSYVHPLQF